MSDYVEFTWKTASGLELQIEACGVVYPAEPYEAGYRAEPEVRMLNVDAYLGDAWMDLTTLPIDERNRIDQHAATMLTELVGEGALE